MDGSPHREGEGQGEALPPVLAALLALGRIGAAEAGQVAALAGARGEAPARVLARLGLAGEDEIALALAGAAGLPVLSEEELALARPHPGPFARDWLARAALLPLDLASGVRVLALADPEDAGAIAAAGFALGAALPPCVAPRGALLARIAALAAPAPADAAGGRDPDPERLRDLAADAPVVTWVEGALDLAISEGASDIHFEPGRSGLAVRHRVDGTLRPAPAPPAALGPAVLSRIKILARLDIAERRLPQDGRAGVLHRGRPVDLRVATAPTPEGETVVIRVLDPARLAVDPAGLGFAERDAAALGGLLARPHGLILVTGPTGSGKTTTLYAMLRRLAQGARKIVSVEDPVEYAVPGVTQIEAAPAIGLTFARALRAMLRHNPDVIMVGEIRDRETAEVAVEAALTGHLVLSTLHTNDAPGAVARLAEMGLPRWLIASALAGVVAQRLLGRLCPDCAAPMPDAPVLARAHGFPDGAGFRAAPGCPKCRGRGTRGRVAAAEVLGIGAEERDLILAGAPEAELGAAILRAGGQRLGDDARAKAAAGIVALADALLVAGAGP